MKTLKDVWIEIKCLWKRVKKLEQNGRSGIQSIQEGDNISVDNTDPQNPIISSTGNDLTTITGYDAETTQTLKHVNGVLQWVTD